MGKPPPPPRSPPQDRPRSGRSPVAPAPRGKQRLVDEQGRQGTLSGRRAAGIDAQVRRLSIMTGMIADVRLQSAYHCPSNG